MIDRVVLQVLEHGLRQRFSQAGDIRLARGNQRGKRRIVDAGQFIGMLGHCKQCRVTGVMPQRNKLMPGATTKAHREQTVRRDIHVIQAVDELVG